MLYGRVRRRGRGGVSPAIVMLLMRIYQQWEALPIKPPVTFGLVGILVAAHLAPELTLPYRVEAICLSSRRVLTAWRAGRFDEVWRRLALSSLSHVDDIHLYYNVGSLLVKGATLEGRLGSETFAILTLYALAAASVVYVIVAALLESWIETGCAVGFSAVLFAFKVVVNYDEHAPGSRARANVWGVQVAARHAHWLELVLASYVNPRSSFVGHGAGIVAGILWTQRHRLAACYSFAARPTRPRPYTYAAGPARPPTARPPDSGPSDVRRRRVERFDRPSSLRI